MIKKFQNISHEYDLWQKGSKIVLGISGGPDSVCLLDIFFQLQKKYQLDFIMAHINYGLRGKDSDQDEKLVRKLAEQYDLKLFILNPKCKSKSENALREIRYRFFEKIRKNNDFDLIAVAHNADDQVETFLMRLIRGSGLAGLSAMRFKNDSIIRPLLGFQRNEILAYLHKNKLDYRIDRTNLKPVFFRNRVRNELLPLLEKFNPSIRKTLTNSLISIAEDNCYISEIVKKMYNKKISAKNFLDLHPSIQKRLILLKTAGKNQMPKDIESVHINEIIKTLKSKKSKIQTVIFKGVRLTRKGDLFNIESDHSLNI